jgi:hypothetical protein
VDKVAEGREGIADDERSLLQEQDKFNFSHSYNNIYVFNPDIQFNLTKREDSTLFISLQPALFPS